MMNYIQWRWSVVWVHGQSAQNYTQRQWFPETQQSRFPTADGMCLCYRRKFRRSRSTNLGV